MNSSLELFSSAKRDDCLDQLQGERYLLINWKRRGVFRSIYGDAGSVRREAATRESHTRSHHQTRPRHCPLPALPLSLLNPAKENSEWEIAPVLHDATNVAGYGIGGLLSAIHGFNTGIPYIQNRVKGPKWLPFVIGLPPLLMYSAASAAFGEKKVDGAGDSSCVRQQRFRRRLMREEMMPKHRREDFKHRSSGGRLT
ncbi:hypothetical protein SASPL_129070 [Salvia splendens]|uniref:Uncharacterized protein n=1 Tax=Salvia splendens TaxID=180675 RepID=A0A8X8ZN48_SALSN|nr:hypothetical protein SASPL_129070 [Salvia splendens]